jgi:transposase
MWKGNGLITIRHRYKIADILESIRDVVIIAFSRMTERKRGAGRPPINNAEIVKVMLIHAYFGTANRIVEGFLRLFGEKLGVSSSLSYKTIERGYDPDRTKKLLDEILRIINESGNSNEKVFSTDGIGNPATMKINYESRRSQQRTEMEKNTKKDHDKKETDAFAVCVHSKIISRFWTSDNHSIGEVSYFHAITEDTVSMCPCIGIMLGDALYSKRKICSITESYGIMPYFMPKTNATFRSGGVQSWKMMLYDFIDDMQEWLENYHMRSISECVNSMIKKKMPLKIRKKLPQRKSAEEFLKANMHNIRQYNYLRHINPEMIRITGKCTQNNFVPKPTTTDEIVRRNIRNKH